MLQLDDRLKALLKRLGKALHHAMAESDDVKRITSEIRKEGYNLFLVMEANIAIEKKEGDQEGDFLQSPPDEPVSIQLTKFDENFLSGMQIKVDDESASQ